VVHWICGQLPLGPKGILDNLVPVRTYQLLISHILRIKRLSALVNLNIRRRQAHLRDIAFNPHDSLCHLLYSFVADGDRRRV